MNNTAPQRGRMPRRDLVCQTSRLHARMTAPVASEPEGRRQPATSGVIDTPGWNFCSRRREVSVLNSRRTIEHASRIGEGRRRAEPQYRYAAKTVTPKILSASFSQMAVTPSFLYARPLITPPGHFRPLHHAADSRQRPPVSQPLSRHIDTATPMMPRAGQLSLMPRPFRFRRD